MMNEELIRDMTQHLELLAAEEARIQQKRAAIKLARRKLLVGYNTTVVLAELHAEKIFDYIHA